MLVSETDKAYKRGVVLGLTLAELLILFVFCLLLLFAAWAGRANERPADEAKSADQTLRTWELIRREMDQLRGVKPIDAFWRELKLVYHEATRQKRTRVETSTGDAVKSQILRELDEMRGDQKLEDYWSELKWARQEAVGQTAVNKVLVTDIDELKRRLSQAEAALERAKRELARAEQNTHRAEEEAKKANEEANRARNDESRVRLELEDFKKKEVARKGHTWPPIIPLPETEGYSFRLGDARLEPAFEKKLREEVIDKIVKYIDEYKVDIIEVVGHTDDIPMTGRQSNLDAMLLPFLSSDRSGAALSAGDNAGLGMARAASVARFLMNDPRLQGRNYRILPLSSAQVLDSDGFLARVGVPRDTPARRRIEIRLRQSEPSR